MDKQVSSTQNPYAEPTSLRGGGGKILVCYHKKDKLFKNDVLVPIHCGRALACEASKDGKMSEKDYQWMLDNMIGDNTGDNISELNRDINEWSAIYWAWKNYDKIGNPDYIGLCHYRRLFDFSDVIKTSNNSLLNRLGLNKKDLNKLLSKYDFVYREGFKVQDNTIHTFDYYQPNVNLSEYYHPILFHQYNKFKEQQILYFNNIFIMKKADFFDMCNEVFTLMFDFLNKPKDEVNQKFLNAVKLKMAPERYQKLKEKSDKNNNWYPRMTSYMMEYISSFYFMHLMEIYKDKALSGHIYTPTNERRTKLLDTIFSVKNKTINSQRYKIVTIAGLKFKHKLKPAKSINNQNVLPADGIIYKENEEKGLANIEIKLERLANGGQFEHEDMVIANKAIGKHFLHNDIKKVVNIGSGVGTFEWYNAKEHPDIKFIASEFDEKSTQWVLDNRKLDNVIYCTDNIPTLLNKYGKFDLAINIDVIEHIKDYKSFLDEFSLLADKAIISTPNRDRYKNIQDLVSPPYKWHTQEFNAGELYFILKMYYNKVTLYSLKNPLDTELSQVGIYSGYEKLIAYCEK